MTDTATPQEYFCQIPASLADDLPAAASYLRHHARDNGWLVTGEPYIHRAEPMNFGTDENPLYLDDDATPYITVRAVAEKAPPKPLPVFVPSTKTIEQAAKKVSLTFEPNLVWDDEPAHVKNFYARLALDVVNAASHHLVADVLEHVGEHRGVYNVTDPAAAAKEVRERA